MIKVNLAPPTTKRPRRATAGGPELNLGLLFGGILAALVLIIGGWWLAMSLEQRRLSAEIDNNKRELARLQPIIAAGQRYRRERDELEKRLNAIETVARNQARPVYLLDAMADTLPPDRAFGLRVPPTPRSPSPTSWPISRPRGGSRTSTWSMPSRTSASRPARSPSR